MKKIPSNLLYLKYFFDAARQGSVSSSAQENHVTQSAISQAIVKLEESLGQDLITHQPNRFRLTPFGESLVQKSRELFSHIRTIEEELIAEPGELRRITFASMHSLSLKILPIALKRAYKRWPKLEVFFRLGHTDAIKEMVHKGLVDFGLVLDNDDFSSFTCYELHRGTYGLYAAKNLSHHKEMPFILSEERREIVELRKLVKKRFGKEPNVLMEVSSWEVIAHLVEEGLGIGFFPDYVAIGKPKLKRIDWKLESIPYRIIAIFPKSVQPSKNLENFLKMCSLAS